jgi:DNA polymerase III gamma/tau subunit
MLTLKYRPQRFSEVLGFPENVRILKGMVKNPARAMRSVILAGEYGNGKTTLARIFGRAVNCQGKTGDACGACANCRAVADDASRLYLELDSTQAGNVESMRNLREILPYSLEEGFRVVVFDECLDYDARVWLADGSLRKIGLIVNNREPVEVVSYDTRTGTFSSKRVVDWHKNAPKPVFDWTFRTTDPGRANVYSLRATGDHRVLTPFGYKALRELKPGDPIEFVRGTRDRRAYRTTTAVFVGQKPARRHGAYTYDLEVEGLHNYIVNGVVVHNCQRISHAAQTNLLKALEEAPPTLFWVFCTTELDKIIKPIQSRSLLVEFGLMGDEDVATLVSRTAQAEGEPVSAEAVRRIVRRAGGHARNALVQLHLLYLLGEREYLDSVPEFDKMLQEMVTSFAEEQGLSDRGVAIIQKILSYPVAYVAQDFERFAVGMAKKAYVDRTGASAKDRLLVAAWLKWHRYLVTAPDWFAFLTGIASLYERNGGGPRIF